MVSCSGWSRATPRGSRVRHRQPRAAIRRARGRYCSWPLPQPCTNSTPGIPVSGATKVPGMRWPSTGISTASSCVAMLLHHCVFGDGPDLFVDALEVHARLRRRGVARPVELDTASSDDIHGRVSLEDLQRGDL